MIKARAVLFCILAAIALVIGSPAQTVSESIPAPSTMSPQKPSQTPSATQPTAPEAGKLQPKPVAPEPAPLSQHEKAEQELKAQTKQRILGIIPNFNTTDMTNAAPLSTSQKFRLAYRSSIDPFEFVGSAFDAGISQARNDFPGYGQGAAGYAKRFASSYADLVDGQLWGNAIFPSLLQEDPRYYRKGNGSFSRRALWALGSAVWAKRDDGTWGVNYANIAGNFVAGGISNAYYPASDRGVGLTFQRATTVTALGALSSVMIEFWPDIERRVFHKHKTPPAAGEPAK